MRVDDVRLVRRGGTKNFCAALSDVVAVRLVITEWVTLWVTLLSVGLSVRKRLLIDGGIDLVLYLLHHASFLK